jgi:hypothetical protein
VAQTCTAYPFNLTNGATADATQVMANFNYVLTCANNQATASILRGWLAGLTLSNDGTNPNTVIDTAAGVANADDATTLMTLAAFTKNANAVWAVGTGNGCLATGSGSSLAANTWYHLFVIARTDTGVVDELCSTSATAPTLPTNYTKKRRIGSFKTDGAAHILAFSQLGDEFIWATPVADVSISNLGTTPVTLTLASVPSGVQINALVRGYLWNTSVAATGLLFPTVDGSTASNTPQGNLNLVNPSTTAVGPGNFNLRTSTSQQIKAVASTASTFLSLVTYGWIDTRGRFN